MPSVDFEISLWFLPLCVLLGSGATYLLYSRVSHWSRLTNFILAGLRFVLLTFLAILLLNPLFKHFINQIEKPSVVIALDNSMSITDAMDSTAVEKLVKQISVLKTELEDKNYHVDIRSFSGKVTDPSGVKFDERVTNLNAFLKDLTAEYENSNLGTIYLFSDGIYNSGMTPTYFPFNIPIQSIGLGDSIQKDDLILKNVIYNKIAYQGNKYPVVAEIMNHGFKDRKARIVIQQNGQLKSQKEVVFTHNSQLTKVELIMQANESGYQRLAVEVVLDGDEEVTVNNRQNIYVDVIDGKQKILLMAPFPHPDLKAMSAVISKNENYEVINYVDGIDDYKEDKFDLVIVHNAFDGRNRNKSKLDQLIKKGVPLFYIMGSATNWIMVNDGDIGLALQTRRNQRDAVRGALNTAFSKYTVSTEINDLLSKAPPLSVPYADYELSLSAEILFYQKLGSVTTNRPLLYFNHVNDKKAAVLLSDGIWAWRMQEMAMNGNADTFDEFFQKMIQYLSTKEDKRKFKFNTSENEYFDNQSVSFEAEMYNDIYERIYGKTIDVVVTGEDFKKEYSFVPVSSFSTLEVSDFGAGVYQYTASVDINGKKETVKGSFTIKELQLEQLDRTANFDLLRKLSSESGGKFYTLDNPNWLQNANSFDFKSIVHAQEDILPIIHIKWLFFVLLLLASSEWFIRKYSGGY